MLTSEIFLQIQIIEKIWFLHLGLMFIWLYPVFEKQSFKSELKKSHESMSYHSFAENT